MSGAQEPIVISRAQLKAGLTSLGITTNVEDVMEVRIRAGILTLVTMRRDTNGQPLMVKNNDASGVLTETVEIKVTP